MAFFTGKCVHIILEFQCRVMIVKYIETLVVDDNDDDEK